MDDISNRLSLATDGFFVYIIKTHSVFKLFI